jgi:hypothetical protein
MKEIIIKKDENGFWAEKVGVIGIMCYVSNGYSSWDKMSYWKTLRGIEKFLTKKYPDYKIINPL